jgi:hypothetical protein
MGALEFGLLIEDGIITEEIPPDLFSSITVYSNTPRLTSQNACSLQIHTDLRHILSALSLDVQ